MKSTVECRLVSTFVFLVIAFILCGQLRAELVRYELTGTIDSISTGSSFGSFDVGDSFTFIIEYETTTPPSSGSTASNTFFDAVKSYTFELGGGGYTSSGTNANIFQRNFSSLDNFNVFDVSLDSHNGEAFTRTGDFFQLRDGTGSAIPDASQLVNPLPGISNWDDSPIFLEFGSTEIDGTITAINSAAIPEPSAVGLIFMGIAGLFCTRRRHRPRC